MNLYILSVTATLLVAVIITRFLPFVFTKQLSQNLKFQVLGAKLPAYIMMLLLIYQLHPAKLIDFKSLIIPFSSLFLVFVIHKLLHRPLLSIACGVVCYYLLLNY